MALSKLDGICGIDCGACPVYSYSHGNPRSLEAAAIVKAWNAMLSYGIDDCELHCDGCRGEKKFVHCRTCPFLECADKKGIASCDVCESKCERLVQYREWFAKNRAGFLFEDAERSVE